MKERVLVMQTARMGDTLQTSPLIHSVREKHPEALISVLVRGMGKAIAERHPDVDEVIIQDENEVFLDLCAEDSDRLLRAYTATDTFVQMLKERQFSVAYNATNSLASAILLKLAEIPHVVGAHLGNEWQFVLRGGWTTYFFTSVFSRHYNDLNLCDIMNHLVDAPTLSQRLWLEVRDEDRAVIDAIYQAHDIGPDDFVACMQLGASETNKRWSEERFAGLAKQLREKKNAKIILVGVEKEAVFGKEFERFAPGIAIHLFGKTNLPQLAALLERANTLITNDTGTMHIAAAVKCPITLTSVGHVHYRETGPYGEGHCAIERRGKRLLPSEKAASQDGERSWITSRQAYKAMELTLAHRAGQSLPLLEETPDLSGVDIYMTRFAPDGFLAFYPVIQRVMEERDFVRMAYRAMWLDHLNNPGEQQKEADSIRQLLACYSGPEPATLEQWQHEIGGMFHQLALLSQRGISITDALLKTLNNEQNMKKASRQVAELMAIDEEARIFSELNPPCRPLALIARYERDNLEGSDPIHLAQTTKAIYQACEERARLMVEKLERIVVLCS